MHNRWRSKKMHMVHGSRFKGRPDEQYLGRNIRARLQNRRLSRGDTRSSQFSALSEMETPGPSTDRPFSWTISVTATRIKMPDLEKMIEEAGRDVRGKDQIGQSPHSHPRLVDKGKSIMKARPGIRLHQAPRLRGHAKQASGDNIQTTSHCAGNHSLVTISFNKQVVINDDSFRLSADDNMECGEAVDEMEEVPGSAQITQVYRYAKTPPKPPNSNLTEEGEHDKELSLNIQMEVVPQPQDLPLKPQDLPTSRDLIVGELVLTD
ncbi:hypothetical protein K2173_006278 [Erythroxylum novogranatense]|uniref:Uncharacterized protein n=1 Tax=Erythroxylum novogranatense TaxID=1862640 RepID=A0AAV8TEN6_9ROSI|nr:hypothetical protein K2173_006278 [Erythroxylum novogranatense]